MDGGQESEAERAFTRPTVVEFELGRRQAAEPNRFERDGTAQISWSLFEAAPTHDSQLGQAAVDTGVGRSDWTRGQKKRADSPAACSVKSFRDSGTTEFKVQVRCSQHITCWTMAND